jgi:hypothetical protein
MRTVFKQKGYKYASVSCCQMGMRKIGESVSADGTCEKIEVSLYRILAGRNENDTALIMHKNWNGNWILEVETKEGDAKLDVFLSKVVTKEEMKADILGWLNRGFKVVEDESGRLYVKN